ncbi:MAG: DNA-processing protein DprA [Pseudomonadales bacterium]|nr:DNA-processing protein DprA [Pseudomonadales bacterium]
MEERCLLAYLRLQNNSLIGPRCLSQTLTHFGSLGELIGTPDQQLIDSGFTGRQIEFLKDSSLFSANPESAEIEAAIQWQSTPGQQLICYESSDYPFLLKEIALPPPLLFCSGNLSLLETPICAIVGSRKASSYGLRIAKWIANELSQLGFTVISGLARGVDSAAHAGALLGSKNTIAVIGTGIDRVYPSSNQALAKQMHSEGLVVSEFALGAPPRAHHFPQRNRIISGLSLGVLVVEASLRSGSLITANLALEQNRNVFAIPGPVDSLSSAGCHKLLREGAKLVASAEDICEDLLNGWRTQSSTTQAIVPTAFPSSRSRGCQLSELERRVVEAITETNMLVDTIVAATRLEPSSVNHALMQLEIKGAVELCGGRVQRCD